MQLVNDEVISLATSADPTPLTRSKLDGTGTTRATVAVIKNHDLGDSAVGYRVDSDPDPDTYAYTRLEPGQEIEISGYNVLRGLKFVNVGTTTAKLYVQYFS